MVKRVTSKRTPVNSKEPINVCSNASLEVTLEIRLPAGCYLTEGVTSNWQFMVFRPQEGKWGYFSHWSLGWQCVLLITCYVSKGASGDFGLKMSLTVSELQIDNTRPTSSLKRKYRMFAIPLDFKTGRPLSRSRKRERSNERSGARVKTQVERRKRRGGYCLLPHMTVLQSKIPLVLFLWKLFCRIYEELKSLHHVAINSHCFKSNRSYSNSFNLSNVGVIFWGWIQMDRI